MSSEIIMIAHFKIHPGKGQYMKDIFDEAIKMVATDEPDTLAFKLYSNEDESVFTFMETYRNSDAVITNFKLSEDRINRVLAASDLVGCEIYGNVSKELYDLTSEYSTKYFKFHGAYVRYFSSKLNQPECGITQK